MRNIYTNTKTWSNFNHLSLNRRDHLLEPRKEVLAFISQFAKVYYIEKPMRFAFSIPIILN